MLRKWKNVSELCERIVEGDMLDQCCKDLACITYAPNIGYRSWIFKYKQTLVCLWDLGNGHWGFHSVVTHADLVVAKLAAAIERVRYRKTRG